MPPLSLTTCWVWNHRRGSGTGGNAVDGDVGGDSGDSGIAIDLLGSGVKLTNTAALTGGNAGTGQSTTVYGKGGAAIAGANLTINDSGNLIGGLNGDGTQTSAIDVTGGANTHGLRQDKAAWCLRQVVASSRRATSSRLSTTGSLRGWASRTSLRARPGGSSVCAKKKRNADTMLFMVGTGTPASRYSTLMPLMIRRSSTRGIPCESGKHGAMRRICAGESQIRSLMTAMAQAGVWVRIHATVSAAYGGDIQMIDSSSIRVHQHAANTKKILDPVAWAEQLEAPTLRSIGGEATEGFCAEA